MFSVSHRDPSTSYMDACTDTPKLRHRNMDFTFVSSRTVSYYFMMLTNCNILLQYGKQLLSNSDKPSRLTNRLTKYFNVSKRFSFHIFNDAFEY